MIRRISILLFLSLLSTTALSQSELRQLKKSYHKDSYEQLEKFIDAWKIDNLADREITHVYNAHFDDELKRFLSNYYFRESNRPDSMQRYHVIPSEIDLRVFHSNDTLRYLINKLSISMPIDYDILNLDYTIDFWDDSIFHDDMDILFSRLKDSISDVLHYDYNKILYNDTYSLNYKDDTSDNILYLTSKYKSIIEDFLGNKGEMKAGGIFVHEEKVRSRYDFLVRCLPIYPGHWGGWHLTTFPEISYISTDDDLNWIAVGESDAISVYEKHYIKVNSGWRQLDFKIVLTY